MSDHGYIPLGKYSSARDDLLHYLCTSDWANDSTGNSVDWNAYVWRISNNAQDVSLDNTEFESVLEDWLKLEDISDLQGLLSELVGHFLVVEYSGGHVGVAQYDTEAALAEDFDKIEHDYAAWDNEENGDDGYTD